VAVTAVWPTEPHHFTPWLLENADVLSEALGIDVELEAREFRVGKFSLDLIGKESSTGNPLIVENQYGSTDHGHLGQLLTYAGGTKPGTNVWIAEQFRDEHRAALEWLNAHTDPEVRFFAVRVGAVTLKGAPTGLIARSLELVVAPNDFEKRAIAATSGAAPSPVAELYKQFSTDFGAVAKQRGWTNASPPDDNWWSMPTGTAGANWTVSYSQFGCRSELFFNHADPAVNLARWKAIHEQKDKVQSVFGDGELIFDDLPKNKGCRIETRLLGPKIGEQDNGRRYAGGCSTLNSGCAQRSPTSGAFHAWATIEGLVGVLRCGGRRGRFSHRALTRNRGPGLHRIVAARPALHGYVRARRR
jgi:Domain of unknown function (DUF4268)